jgi:hypothetical protein
VLPEELRDDQVIVPTRINGRLTLPSGYELGLGQ